MTQTQSTRFAESVERLRSTVEQIHAVRSQGGAIADLEKSAKVEMLKLRSLQREVRESQKQDLDELTAISKRIKREKLEIEINNHQAAHNLSKIDAMRSTSYPELEKALATMTLPGELHDSSLVDVLSQELSDRDELLARLQSLKEKQLDIMHEIAEREQNSVALLTKVADLEKLVEPLRASLGLVPRRSETWPEISDSLFVLSSKFTAAGAEIKVDTAGIELVDILRFTDHNGTVLVSGENSMVLGLQETFGPQWAASLAGILPYRGPLDLTAERVLARVSEIAARHKLQEAEIDAILRGNMEIGDWKFREAQHIKDGIRLRLEKEGTELIIECRHTEFFAQMRLSGQELCSEHGLDVPVHAPLAIAARRGMISSSSIKDRIASFLEAL